MKRNLAFLGIVLLVLLSISSCSFFLKDCEHNYAERVVSPTCSAEGYTEHTCTECGDSYSDAVTPKILHSYSDNVVSPTCTAEGYTEHTCIVCGDSFNDAVTSKILHSYGAIVVSPTCSAEGYTEHTCIVCGDSFKDAVTPKTAHSYDVTVVSPTCSAEGYTEHTCSVCGDSYTDGVTIMTSHRFNDSACLYCETAEITENITADTEWYSTESISFVLTTKEQLAGLAALVNAGTVTSDQSFHLGADIDLEFYEWIPIGNAENPFSATFYGEGYTISSLKISTDSDYVGLFGNVTGSISNFSIENATVYLQDTYKYVAIACGYSKNELSGISVSGYVDAAKSDYVGGVLGYSDPVSAIFSKLESFGEVNGKGCVGGVFGAVSATATVHADGLLNLADVTGETEVGGIAGVFNAKIGSSVYNTSVCAKIEGNSYVGGIIGKTESVTVQACTNEGSEIIANFYYTNESSFYACLGGYVGSGYRVVECVNTVEIAYNSRGSYVGGIAGLLVGGIDDCENTAQITGYSDVGGLVGALNISAVTTISNLKNTASVSGISCVGGIVGKCTSTQSVTLTALENGGEIRASGSRAGGIVGAYNDGGSSALTTSSLVNTADVYAEHTVGGLFGCADGSSSSVIKNSSSSASVFGAYYVGGIVGRTTVIVSCCENDGTQINATGWFTDGETDFAWVGGYVGKGYKVNGCTNNSDIIYSGTGIYVGGIVGYATNEVKDCTNGGNISSKSNFVGGIAGIMNNINTVNITYSNLTNTGNVAGANYVGGIFGQLHQSINVVKNSPCGKDTYSTQYLNDIVTKCSNMKNSGDISGNARIGGIFGGVSLENTGSYLDRGTYSYYSDHYHEGRSKLEATGFENLGVVSGSESVGEMMGFFWADCASTVSSYTVTGNITVNGDAKEGDYDVGSKTNLTLSAREIYVADPETDEIGGVEGEEVTPETNAQG